MKEHSDKCYLLSNVGIPSVQKSETECDCDGYHTFNELYEHRCRLFIALMWAKWRNAWASKVHADGSIWEGWFIAGIHTKSGDITYHLPIKYWDEIFMCRKDGEQECIITLDKAPEWDGHTSDDVLERLKNL